MPRRFTWLVKDRLHRILEGKNLLLAWRARHGIMELRQLRICSRRPLLLLRFIHQQHSQECGDCCWCVKRQSVQTHHMRFMQAIVRRLSSNRRRLLLALFLYLYALGPFSYFFGIDGAGWRKLGWFPFIFHNRAQFSIFSLLLLFNTRSTFLAAPNPLKAFSIDISIPFFLFYPT